MLVLAFESSAKAASVALVKDGKLLSQYYQCTSLTHSRTLLPMCEDLLKNAELQPEDVDLIACAQGPGSFTGIRIGVSTVKGMAWALDKPCVGVSTLEAMAWNGLNAGKTICCVMDARRNQVYNALFKIEDGRPVRLCEDRAISLEKLIEDVKQLGQTALLVGDGTEITAAAFDQAEVNYQRAPDNLEMQSAWGVAKAAEGKESYASQDLLPVYLRLSQAERERQERMKND